MTAGLDPVTIATTSASRSCNVCGQPALHQCAGCVLQPYCSKEHQREDWTRHRAVCQSKIGTVTSPIGDEINADDDDNRSGIINAILRAAYYVGGAAQRVAMSAILAAGDQIEELVKFTRLAANALAVGRDKAAEFVCHVAAQLPSFLEFLVDLTGSAEAVNDESRASFTANEARHIKEICRRVFSGASALGDWMVDLMRQALRIMTGGLSKLAAMVINVADVACLAFGKMIEWCATTAPQQVRKAAEEVLLPAVVFAGELPTILATISNAAYTQVLEVMRSVSAIINKSVKRFVSENIISKESQVALIEYIKADGFWARVALAPTRAFDWVMNSEFLRFLTRPIGFLVQRLNGTLIEYGTRLVETAVGSGVRATQQFVSGESVIFGRRDVIETAKRSATSINTIFNSKSQFKPELVKINALAMRIAEIDARGLEQVRAEAIKEPLHKFAGRLIAMTWQDSKSAAAAWMAPAGVKVQFDQANKDARARVITGLTDADYKEQEQLALQLLVAATPLFRYAKENLDTLTPPENPQDSPGAAPSDAKGQQPVSGVLDFFKGKSPAEKAREARERFRDATDALARQHLASVQILGLDKPSVSPDDLVRAAEIAEQLSSKAHKRAIAATLGVTILALYAIWYHASVAAKLKSWNDFAGKYLSDGVSQYNYKMIKGYSETLVHGLFATSAAEVVATARKARELALQNKSTENYVYGLQRDKIRFGIYLRHIFFPAFERLQAADPKAAEEFRNAPEKDHDLIAKYYEIPDALQFAAWLADETEKHRAGNPTIPAPGWAVLNATKTDEFIAMYADNKIRMGMKLDEVIVFKQGPDQGKFEPAIDPTKDIAPFVPKDVTFPPGANEALVASMETMMFGTRINAIALPDEQVAYLGQPPDIAKLTTGQVPSLPPGVEGDVKAIADEMYENQQNQLVLKVVPPAKEAIIQGTTLTSDVNSTMEVGVNIPNNTNPESPPLDTEQFVRPTGENMPTKFQSRRMPAVYKPPPPTGFWGTTKALVGVAAAPRVLEPVAIKADSNGKREITVHSEGVMKHFEQHGEMPKETVQLSLSSITGHEVARALTVRETNAEVAANFLLNHQQETISQLMSHVAAWERVIDFTKATVLVTMDDDYATRVEKQKRKAKIEAYSKSAQDFSDNLVVWMLKSFDFVQVVWENIKWAFAKIGAWISSALAKTFKIGGVVVNGLSTLYLLGWAALLGALAKLTYDLTFAAVLRSSATAYEKKHGLKALLPLDYEMYVHENWWLRIIYHDLRFFIPAGITFAIRAIQDVLLSVAIVVGTVALTWATAKALRLWLGAGFI